MCGITGIFDCQSARTIDRAVLEQMNLVQAHRGPDAAGFFVDQGIGLGHRRLSIIDISSGQQPMMNEEKSIVVVFNGEIYNYQQLKVELKRLGYTFKTNSDTEVLIYGYMAWGQELPKRLRGMFAFALWDKNDRTMFLVRDRLGIKPLYYSYLATGELIFASELKGIMQHPKVSRTLNPQAVSDYFAYGYIPEPNSIFKQVYKLNPGHFIKAKWGQSQFEQVAYWDILFEPTAQFNEAQWLETLRGNIDEAVKLRLISEVPLGAFLSGGVDSSVVVNTMAQLMDIPVTTCSIGFNETAFDESIYSNQVAQSLHTSHHLHKLSALDLPEQSVMSIYDEPFADSSCLPTLRVCEAARAHVTVALSGDGGDEVFAGYRRYRGHLLEESFRNFMPLSIRKKLFGPLASLYPRLKRGPRWLRAKATLESLCYDAISGYFNNISIFKPHWHHKLFTKSFKKTLQGYQPIEVLKNHAANTSKECPLSLIQYLDIKTYLPGDILTKVDRASMHHSLEVRVPLLDHELVQMAGRMPPSLKLKHQTGKYILKKAYEGQLSDEILYRRKQGFAVPLNDWFRGPLKDRALRLANSKILSESDIIDMRQVKSIVSQHINQRMDYSAMIWTLCMFEDFMSMTFINQKEEGYARTACA